MIICSLSRLGRILISYLTDKAFYRSTSIKFFRIITFYYTSPCEVKLIMSLKTKVSQEIEVSLPNHLVASLTGKPSTIRPTTSRYTYIKVTMCVIYATDTICVAFHAGRNSMIIYRLSTSRRIVELDSLF